MASKFPIVVIVIFVFIAILWNQTLIPIRLEVAELEPIRVIGFDYVDEENVSLTVIRENIKEEQSGSSSSGSKGGESGGGKNEAITVTADTFENAMRALQLYTTKQIMGDHVKYILIGEKLAEKELYSVMDFIARDEEFRFNSFVYVVKDTPIEEFLKGQVDSKEFLAEKLGNLEKHIDDFGFTSETKLLTILNFLLEPEQKGLISTISVINDEDAFGFSIESSDEDRAKESVSFLGYAHIKNGKLYEYLSPEISRGANILKNNLKTAPITIEDDEGNKINLDVQRVVTDYKFEFEGDELKKVYIKSRIRSNFSHITNILNIYDNNTVGEYENKQADVLVKEISGVMNKMKETNSDFINLLGELKMKHPYKYQKIKDKWTEILPNLEYEVYVESQISRTYDVFDRLILGEG